MTLAPRTPTLAGRLLELRSLIQSARWSLLDAIVLINELYEQAVAIEQAHTPTLGPEDPEPDHEDYVPGEGSPT